MLDLAADYTTDPATLLALTQEIDFFVIQSITAATNLYIGLYKERLQENTHFIQKVAETVPGAVYVFDLERFSGIYSNKKLGEIIGYSQAELNELGENTIELLVHPDDKSKVTRESLANDLMKDDTRVVTYRIRKKDGSYKWLANYESIFKRKEDGSIWQIIGITLDVDKEQKAMGELHIREQLLLEAQEIAQLGNYYWDFTGKNSYGSAKTMELLEITSPDLENFMKNVHEDDRKKVEEATEQAQKDGVFNCEYRIKGSAGIKYIWARGIVEFLEGKPFCMKGTVMDVTEHNLLIRRLEEADKRHKQAEALAHIGTYSWNFVKGELEWSDEMYRIYGIDVTESISYNSVTKAVHADDKVMLERIINESIATGRPFDFYYHITARNGETKILHSRGKLAYDSSGKPEKLVGTDQDVTEKQTLIHTLRQTESLYKQAEEIASMGNWNWDVASNKLEWTDQLYRIYGLEPQTEEITIERFLSFVHPEDREYVTQGVDELKSKDSIDYTFRIITNDGTEKWLRSIAQVLRNERGEVATVIGTEQDVTEKQKLIGKLEESQRLYKQAQELAKMGNFSWNMQTGEVFWSDEVYKIYERPYGEDVRFEDAFDPITEQHKPHVQRAIEETIQTKQGRSISYAIRKKDGGVKYINLHTDVGLNKDSSISCIIGSLLLTMSIPANTPSSAKDWRNSWVIAPKK
ncbi:MAG: PAS domain S-box protein [Chitinophagaceae bacterium]|nr:MAG: PAS domain S-box protein [Chitinophagaceae bacterium]